jgi:LysR family transcriptional regulator, benzoate and cis,cis-muconate-responsive activator of ben and cat genes
METGAGLLSLELRTLIVVADAGSFSRAAHRLGVEQSTVSRRIRDLEDGLGVSLFERYAHGVRLTSAGRAFLDEAVLSQATLSHAVTEARQAATAETGRLRLGFVWSFAAGVAVEILGAYRARHPAVRLQFTELGAAELLKRVLTRQIDLAWIVQWHDLDPVLEVEPLWSEALNLAVPTSSQLEGPQDWGVLAKAPYLCRASEEWRHFQGALDQVGGPRMDIRAHDCSRESLLSLVAAGDGVSLITDSIAQTGYPGVRFLPMKDPRGRLDICAIWRRETDNPALRRFLAVTRSWVKKHRPPPPSCFG